MSGRRRERHRVAVVPHQVGKSYVVMDQREEMPMKQMNHDEINQWIRWQQCKVTLAMVAQYLPIVLIPLTIIVWIVSRYSPVSR